MGEVVDGVRETIGLLVGGGNVRAVGEQVGVIAGSSLEEETVGCVGEGVIYPW